MKYTVWASQYLKKNKSYKVHSVYKRTVNIEVENRILAFHPAEISLTPLSIGIALSERQFQEFSESARQNGFIFLGENKIYAGLGEWELKEDEIWNPIPDFGLELSQIETILKEIEFFLCLNGKEYEGISDGALFQKKKEADSLITSFFRSKIKEIYILGLKNPEKLSELLIEMIGLGYGLTPSGDDFLTGIMMSFRMVMPAYEREKRIFLKNVYTGFDRTNDISRQYLNCAFHGEFSIVWHELFKNWDDREKIKKNLMCIQQIGHTSGIDTLNGVYVGLKLMKDKEERKDIE